MIEKVTFYRKEKMLKFLSIFSIVTIMRERSVMDNAKFAHEIEATDQQQKKNVLRVISMFIFRHDSKVHQYRILPGPDGKLYVQVNNIYCQHFV